MQTLRLFVWMPIFFFLLLSGGCMRTMPLLDMTSPVVPDRKVLLEVVPEPEAEVSEEAQNTVPETESKAAMNQVLYQFQKGIQLLERGRSEEARFLFEELRERYPEVSVVHNNLGVTYKRLSLLQEATRSYQKAIDLQGGGYTEAHYNLAIIFREQGAFRKAEVIYLKVIALNPEFEDAHYNLAVLYDLYLDKPEEALQHYRKYMELVDGNHQEIELWVTALQKRLSTSVSEKKPERQ
ncbi:MAG: tetratricopeptide repeat protein [Nitrospira sp.]|nr:tetratricopeptide repeat protein [Candidatus Manganitrophaceae bacterium]HIL34845.1 tetratricopeptide repeat protein [Candidatus Manganitrophaceae bacterium]